MNTQSANNGIATPGARKKLTFLDLPTETQQSIFSHCSQTDLIYLSLVSKHFHELASGQLYRNFHIIFPDDDDNHFDSPIDGLAGGLDTFTTSDYNYGKHLKDLSMDTLSSGWKGEESYQSYLYSASCGKFLNTLLQLTLKKAKALEAFRWNIRVELSRPVYRELHGISSLKKLHIRMQAGESYYMPPPPLPASLPGNVDELPAHLVANARTPSYHVVLGDASVTTGLPTGLVPPSKSLPKSRASTRGLISREPSTLSGFKNLKSLSVLDIDDLDIVTELRACVNNSASTLTELQLSLSRERACRARKPSTDPDPDDSDIDDEFQLLPGDHDAAGPTKAHCAQSERRVQEAMLGRIFDIDPFTTQESARQEGNYEKDLPSTQNMRNVEKQAPTDKDTCEMFFGAIRVASSHILFLLDNLKPPSTLGEECAVNIPDAAANARVESSGCEKPTVSDSHSHSEMALDEAVIGALDQDQFDSPIDQTAPCHDNDDTDTSIFDTGINTGIESLNIPDEPLAYSHNRNINMTSQNTDLAKPERESHDSTTPPDRIWPKVVGKDMNCQSYLESLRHLQHRLAELREQILQIMSSGEHARDDNENTQKLRDCVLEISSQAATIEDEMITAERKQFDEPHSDGINTTASLQQSMNSYLRNTRGISLESLSINLMPVTATVLSQKLNLRSLKQLTLLKVGNQSPIWTLLAKENQLFPLALRSVFTDNVSEAFLTCISEIEEFHELFMLEPSLKYKPESVAPVPPIDRIRRVVLSKHMPTLKRLMIKDESISCAWDITEKTMIHICNRGRQLEELAVTMNIHSVHAFMQYFSGLVKLRAIHILHFRNNDTCIWVTREIRRFIVDNLSHHPELKLEWIAMEDDRVDRVVRPPPLPSSSLSSGMRYSQHTAINITGTAHGLHGNYSPASSLSGIDSESESEDEDGIFVSGARLRYQSIGPLPFYDVFGVKIFEKEIRNGTL